MKRWIISFVALGVLALLAACASAVTGSLAVQFSGLPAGVAGEATVTGSGGFSQSVTGDDTLTRLEPGTYTVSVASVVGNESVVSYVYSPSQSSQTVSVSGNSTTNVSVSYQQDAASGRFWQPSDSSTIVGGFDRSLLLSTGSASASALISDGTSSFDQAVAFDSEGNAWVTSWTATEALRKFSAADLVADGSPTAEVTITPDGGSPASLNDPVGLAFDANGNLWVATYSSSRLEMFTSTQLAGSGNPTPETVITSASINSPIGLAFDSSGNLWVASALGGNELSMFTPAQLSAGGSVTASVVISPDGSGSLNRPFGLAFDANGNLWVANLNNNTVVRFGESQLQTTGSPTPVATIDGATFTSTGPTSVVIDHDGNLWVGHTFGHTLSKIENPATLSGTVTPTVAVEISTSLSWDAGLTAIYPAPGSSPINVP